MASDGEITGEELQRAPAEVAQPSAELQTARLVPSLDCQVPGEVPTRSARSRLRQGDFLEGFDQWESAQEACLT